MSSEAVNHPAHYGGDTTYECIKVLEAWNWELAYHFCTGNAIKYYSRLGKKGSIVENLKKAGWYATKAVEIWERHNGTGGEGGDWGQGGGTGASSKITVKHHAGSSAQFPLPNVGGGGEMGSPSTTHGGNGGNGGTGFVSWEQAAEARGPVNDSLNRRAG